MLFVLNKHQIAAFGRGNTCHTGNIESFIADDARPNHSGNLAKSPLHGHVLYVCERKGKEASVLHTWDRRLACPVSANAGPMARCFSCWVGEAPAPRVIGCWPISRRPEKSVLVARRTMIVWRRKSFGLCSS